MPAYDEIRKAIGDGLHLANLHIILRTSYKIIEEESPKHPAAFLLLAVLARWGIESWRDEEVLPLSEANRIESVLRPYFETVTSILDGDAREVCSVLDKVTSDFYRQLAAMPER